MRERSRGRFYTRVPGRVQSLAVCLLAAAAAVGAPVASAANGQAKDPGPSAFDIRSQERAAAPALANPERAAARARLGDAIGGQAIVELDNLTGTPRFLGRLDGYLTGASSSSASDVVLGYLRDHLSALGLREADLAHLRLADSFSDSAGVRHLTWQQELNGIVAFDNFVRASVTGDGRLIDIVGSPLPGLALRSLAPKQSAEAALGASLRDVGGTGLPLSATSVRGDPSRSTEFAGGHTARLVLLGTAGGPRLAWLVTARASSTAYYVELRDAYDGSLLYRANLVKYAAGTGRAWRYYPGAASGGTRGSVSFPVYDGSKLRNSRTHTWSDVNDDDTAQTSEEVPANSGTSWNPPFTTSFPSHDGVGCSPSFPCTWNSSVANSWAANRAQDTQQVFWFVNNFHDWLARPQIGFTPASHSFETTDPVLAQADDGANTAGGFPDDAHIANANMSTPPDGESPTMQMYLFPGGLLGASTPDANGGDDASVVYHEYTHGLSNRLITDGVGFGALDSFQAGSMGEAWSDWYAMDYVTRFHYEPDTPAHGEVVVGRYLTRGSGIRTEPLDCVPGDLAGGRCPGTPGAGLGGYTYGDLGQVVGSPEVHADGEIWGQLLWQLRDALIDRWGGSIGSDHAEKIVTGAMRLSPPEPSMLDMRNALIMADHVYNGQADLGRVVAVVTRRGMGYFASTTGSGDTRPYESFAAWPAHESQSASVHGVLKDADTNAPIAGATVFLGGHTSVFDVHSTTTNASGQYTLTGLYPGHTYHVIAARSGYDLSDNAVAILPGSNTANLTSRHDWANGAAVAATGPDYSDFGCGPDAAVDGSLDTGWSTDSDGPGFPFQIVVTLPNRVNLTASGGLQLAPGADCGDPVGNALAHYQLHTSQNGTTWNLVSDATFAPSDNGNLHPLAVPTAARSNVRYLKLVMLSNQSGVDPWIDMRELKAYGTAAP